MPKILYIDKRFSRERAEVIRTAEQVINRYVAMGYRLTLRQLYYRFVADDLFPANWADPVLKTKNTQRNYKKLGDILNDARLAGLIDWEAIEDRTRELAGNSHWDSPAQIIQACASQFQIDKWQEQKHYVEAWVEKDALEGVVGKAAREMDINFFSCRGYVSQSSMWEAARRLRQRAAQGRECVVLHLGDHDPSGLDMTRDIQERLILFMEDFSPRLTVKRIALTMEQIEEYGPPSNPAKVTDSRFEECRLRYGEESWELDALDPAVIESLIVEQASQYRENKKFEQRQKEEKRHRDLLSRIAGNWDELSRKL